MTNDKNRGIVSVRVRMCMCVRMCMLVYECVCVCMGVSFSTVFVQLNCLFCMFLTLVLPRVCRNIILVSTLIHVKRKFVLTTTTRVKFTL